MASTTTNRAIELIERNTPNSDSSWQDSSEEPLNTQQLRPADGGLAAWRLLLAAFVFEALLWGFPISFGVFQNYYSELPKFKNDPKIALIGTIAQGSVYLGAPLAATAARRFPKYQRIQIYVGWPICIGGLIAGSFTNTLGGLIATQGVMYGVGFVTLTYPIVSMVDEWWVARKGMAFGMISAASGASGVVMPFIIEALLKRYGYKTALRAIAVSMVLLTGPLLPLLKGRLPPAEQSAMAKTNWNFLKKPLFSVFSFSVFLQGLGFFFPPLYLPSHAAAIGLPPTQGALLLAVMSIAQVFGQFAFGYLSDKSISVSILAVTCSIISAIASLTLWGLAHSLVPLVVFSIVYGFFAYGYTTMRVAMGRAVSDDPTAAVATYAILVFVQGIGNILAGPISAALLLPYTEKTGYGIGRYRTLVIFTGSCIFSSAVVIALWHARPKRVT